MALAEIGININLNEEVERSLDINPADLSQGAGYLKAHKSLAETSATVVKQPYWKFSPEKNNGSPPKFYEQFVRGNFLITIGPATEFPVTTMAVGMEALLDSYFFHKTFKQKDQPVPMPERDAIKATMLGGFNKDRVVISIIDLFNQIYVGGCMVDFGSSDNQIKDLIGNSYSSLSTLSSLQFPLKQNTPFEVQLATTKEKNAACFMRFFRIPAHLLPFGINQQEYFRQFSMEALSGMARAVNHWNIRRGDPENRIITATLLDTHDPKIPGVLADFYGGNIISNQAQATGGVIYPHPLGAHYSEFDEFTVIGFDVMEQLEKAYATHNYLGDYQKIVYKEA